MSAQATLDEADESLTKTSIYAPMAGTISSLSVELGERVVGTSMMSGTEMLRIADLIESHADELAVLGVRDNGTEIGMALKAEPLSAAGTVRYYAEALDKVRRRIADCPDDWLAARDDPGFRAVVYVCAPRIAPGIEPVLRSARRVFPFCFGGQACATCSTKIARQKPIHTVDRLIGVR